MEVPILKSFMLKVPVLLDMKYIMSSNINTYIALFPGSHASAQKREPGTHCLHMLNYPRISGN